MKKFLNSKLLPVTRNSRYYNHEQDHPESFLFQTIPSFVQSVLSRKKVSEEFRKEWVCDLIWPDKQADQIAWLGHATFLMSLSGVTILTDPVFGSPSRLFARTLALPLAPADLPPIDFVLLSHNHPDHHDLASLQQLRDWQNITYLVPQGDRAWLVKKGCRKVIEYTWWEQEQFQVRDSTIEFTFLPACHWSQRGLVGRNKSLWGSWMIQAASKSIYFGGDTAYWEHFQAIKAEFDQIDVALLPIAPAEPSPWMQRTHMSAEQALKAFQDLNAGTFIPMHWGTFPFGKDDFQAPIDRLKAGWTDVLATHKKIIIPKVGQLLTHELFGSGQEDLSRD